VRCSLALVFVVACGAHNNDTGDAHGGSGSDAFAGPFPDFPGTPIIEPGVPPDAPGLFGAPGTGAPSGGPCMVEPEVGTLYPQNWLRPRFSWVPTGNENLFELRLTAANQINPLVVYTTSTTWTMPAAIWSALATDTVEQPITVAVRGATYDGVSALTSGPTLGSTGPITVAGAKAPGAIVYWTTSNGTWLRGFHIGEETVHDIVQPADDSASTQCVGCHSSTPDGSFVAYSASPVAGNGDPATLGFLSADGAKSRPAFISASAQTLLARQGQELPTFSRSHWQPGDYTAVTMFAVNAAFEIMWTDLEATSTAQGTGWGVIARGGDPNPAAYASFAHTSDTLLYVSSPAVGTGVTSAHGNIMTVPYGARAGGTATPVTGADTATYNEYYPTWSPDDRYIGYNRVADGANSYANDQAEVFAIPAVGGAPVRLVANDPPACSGKTSPGVQNSWPKWAPDAADANGKRYYWLTFSSTRLGGIPQLFVTPLVQNGAVLELYPALYLWNQPPADHNHTPAWDNFSIVQ
jgi:hypothetical protein